MKFGLMFFSSSRQIKSTNKYEMLIEASRFADQNDFCSIWTPERHFHEFGGMFPNPAVLSAALAMITTQIQLRAGSLISPLHDVVRIAENWSIVDNLSQGRVALSFGAGWNADDFIFFPERYSQRQSTMYEQIEALQTLWQGQPLERKNGIGKRVSISIQPQPVQNSIPIWVTSSGNVETFIQAGMIGANLLTHLISQDSETLGQKITQYRRAREENGFDPQAGVVSLMLHTYMSAETKAAQAVAYHPFRQYIQSAVNLEQMAAIAGGAISGGYQIDAHDISQSVMDELLDIVTERYFHTASLIGSVAHCKQLIWQLESIGVNEIACLIDFINDPALVLEGLPYLNKLRESFTEVHAAKQVATYLNAFIEDFDE